MDELISRITRAVVFSSITFASGYFLTGSIKTATALALVPFVLTCLALLSAVGYLVTGLTFLAAVGVAIFGTSWIDSGQRLVETVVQRADELAPRPATAPSPASDPKAETARPR